MIVKVQGTKLTNDEVDKETKMRVLIYDEDRSVMWQGPLGIETLALCLGFKRCDVTLVMFKCYAHAHMEGTIVVLDKEAPWQEW